ncbi:juvenile hormone esterase-like [Anticarsia gemmatalis]|uniref:juvenile hormone esterase-like n=1 Tax=Anticarsia gemmatalis TaxID=129554 RepID=UPI003F759936
MSGLSVKWLVLWSLWAARLVRQPTTILQLSNGPTRGVVAPDGSHVQYLAIPYATVRERFQKPGPEPLWDDVFDAVNENVRCTQGLANSVTIGKRQCLILNVYTPLNATPGDKLPVMTFFHGGGFFQGSGGNLIYGPKYLVSKNVILVTVNYRLNIQGFLCLGIKENPGNAAMKDQSAALRWINKNIENFGGDKNNVLLFGESAGAASVSYHLYSPMSKGLFHKVITQSGSALAPWAFQYRPVFLASLLAKTMLYESQDAKDLYNYFMTKSDDDLILTRVPRKDGNIITTEILYTPCAEPLIEGEEPFLTEHPYDKLTRGDYNKVPVIIGSNNEEGLLIMSMDNDTTIPHIRFEKSLPKNLHIPLEKDRKEIADKLQKLYMDGEEISMKTAAKISRWVGELNLNYPSLQESELLLRSDENPVFNYLFQYAGRRNLAKNFLPTFYKEVAGATHADELFYLFSQNVIPTLFEYDMVDKLTTLWTNFAKYSDPTPDFTNPPVKWHRTNSSTPTALVIDTEFSTAPLWFNERVKYIRELYSKFRRKYL